MGKGETIVKRIKEQMQAQGYYHYDMADLLFIGPVTWRDRMHNPGHFRLDELEAVEEILHIEILKGEDNDSGNDKEADSVQNGFAWAER